MLRALLDRNCIVRSLRRLDFERQPDFRFNDEIYGHESLSFEKFLVSLCVENDIHLPPCFDFRLGDERIRAVFARFRLAYSQTRLFLVLVKELQSVALCERIFRCDFDLEQSVLKFLYAPHDAYSHADVIIESFFYDVRSSVVEIRSF